MFIRSSISKLSLPRDLYRYKGPRKLLAENARKALGNSSIQPIQTAFFHNITLTSHYSNNHSRGHNGNSKFSFLWLTAMLAGLTVSSSECKEPTVSPEQPASLISDFVFVNLFSIPLLKKSTTEFISIDIINGTIDKDQYHLLTNNGRNTNAIKLLYSLSEVPIPKEQQAEIIQKVNRFLKHINSQCQTDSEKLKALKLYIKGYKQFFLHYKKFPQKLKTLYNNPDTLDKCDHQLYHIAKITRTDKNISDGVFYHNTKPTQDSLEHYRFYKSSVENLSKSGITALGKGRGEIHIPWSLAASKIVMKCLENSRNDSISFIEKNYSGAEKNKKMEELEKDYISYVETLSNSILKLVIWAVTVDDIPDSMSKEMPKLMNQTFLKAMKLISDTNTRNRAGFTNPDDIFTVQDGELNKIKNALNEIPNQQHRKACEYYIEGAYRSFHSAWDALQPLTELSTHSKSKIRSDFRHIMNSFQHALEVNYDPKPFNIQKAEDVHYGMHIVIFFEMALSLAEKLKIKHTGTSYIESKSDDYVQLFWRQALLMQQMGSIANLICTGISEEGNVSRKINDGDFSNQLIFDALHKLSKGKNPEDEKKVEHLKSLLNRLTSFKEMRREWFEKYSSNEELTGDNQDEKESLEKFGNITVNNLAETITDALPDLFDKWISLYNSLENYDENEQLSQDAVLFLFQNIVVRGKL